MRKLVFAIFLALGSVADQEPPALADAAEKTGIAARLHFGEMRGQGDIPTSFYLNLSKNTL